MKVGITFSSFNLLRFPKANILKETKKKCDYLIVGLQLNTLNDKSKKSNTSQLNIDRYIQLKNSEYVDEIIPYSSEQDVEDILKSYKIDVLIIREEYKTIDFIGKEYCTKKGIEIHYSSIEHLIQNIN